MDKNKIELVKEAAQKLLKFFSESNLKFESVKIEGSDSVIEYGSLEIGADVSISTTSGSEPAPDGEYTLVNGVVITVLEGKISEIESEGDEAKENATDTDESLADAPVAEEKPVEDKPVDSKSDDVKALEDRLSKLEELVKTLTAGADKAPSKEDLNSFGKQITELNKSISDLAKIPTQFSIDNRVEVKEDEMEKYRRIANRYSK